MSKNPESIIPGVSVETTRIYEYLLQQPVGNVVEWKTLCELTGKDLPKTRGYLNTALRRLRAHHRHVWGTIRKVGIKRLNDGGIVVKVEGKAKSYSRQLRRNLKDLACADYDKLTPHEKARHDAIAIGTRTARLFLHQDPKPKPRVLGNV